MPLSQLQTTFLANFHYLNPQDKRNSRFGFSLNNNKALTTFLERQAGHLSYSVSTATNDHEVINAIIMAISKAYCERTALQYRTREIVTTKRPGERESDSHYVETCKKQGEFEGKLLTALTACSKARGIDPALQARIMLLKNRIENLPIQMQVELKPKNDSTGRPVPTVYRSENFESYLHTGVVPEAFLSVAPSEGSSFWYSTRKPIPVAPKLNSEFTDNVETRPRSKC